MNSRILLLISSLGLSSAFDLTFTPVSGTWKADETNTISWTPIAGSSYTNEIVNIELYGPTKASVPNSQLNPVFNLETGVNAAQVNSISKKLPATLESGNYFVCAVQGTTATRCTTEFPLVGVTTPTTSAVAGSNTDAPTVPADSKSDAQILARGAGVATSFGLLAYLLL